MKNLKQEIKALNLKYSIIEKTDIENVIVYSNDMGVCFFWNGKKASKKEVLKIFNTFKPSLRKEDNKEITFADSSKNFKTDSSIFLKWSNWSRGSSSVDLKICYTSVEGYKISINIPSDFYPSNYSFWKVKKGRHLGFGRYEHERSFYIDTPFYLQTYSGGTCLYYFLEGAESIDEYINFIFTGVFKYDDELTLKIQ